MCKVLILTILLVSTETIIITGCPQGMTVMEPAHHHGILWQLLGEASHLTPPPCSSQWIVKPMYEPLTGAQDDSGGRGSHWRPSTGTGLPILILPKPSPPPEVPHALFSVPLGPHSLFPTLTRSSHSTRPNTLLLIYYLKSCKAFENVGMNCFFTWPNGAIPEQPPFCSTNKMGVFRSSICGLSTNVHLFTTWMKSAQHFRSCWTLQRKLLQCCAHFVKTGATESRWVGMGRKRRGLYSILMVGHTEGLQPS